jgi:hypothetical protein
MMFSSVIIRTFELFPLLPLPTLFAYSPTSPSAKIQIFMVISALATYLCYPQTGNSIFSSLKDFVVEHPIEIAVLSVAVGSPLKYLQHKLRFARINAIDMNNSTPLIPASPERFEKRFERRAPGYSKVNAIDKPEDVLAFDKEEVYGPNANGIHTATFPIKVSA